MNGNGTREFGDGGAGRVLPVVELIPLEEGDREAFIADNQEAFNYGALVEAGRGVEDFEEEGQIISRETIEKSLDEGEGYRIVLKGRKVGGVVLRTDGERGELELLFVAPEVHGRGIGQAAWRAVEALHPEVRVWETVTPYFEKRNIHFYVNKCGFRIVEFFRDGHPGAGRGEDGGGEMFRFEKRVER